MYSHLFGPVPSRRLGMSLGVDLVPHKVCSLNCVYCECGATTRLTRERKEYVPLEEIRQELEHYFSHQPDPDYITFSGAGEPTLHSRIGEVMDLIKDLRPGVKLAVITNATLFSEPGVRQDLLKADLVLPSLDAATDDAFRRINRPEVSLTLNKYIQGILDFKSEFHGSLWLEVLILPGYNDDRENLQALKGVLMRIAPERIQLNTLDRPGTRDDLRPATPEELEAIATFWGFDNLDIILPRGSRHSEPSGQKEMDASVRKGTKSTILETIQRRPCTAEDLSQMLGIAKEDIEKWLSELVDSGRISLSKQDRGTFYQVRKS